jgi:hypothetical protein
MPSPQPISERDFCADFGFSLTSRIDIGWKDQPNAAPHLDDALRAIWGRGRAYSGVQAGNDRQMPTEIAASVQCKLPPPAMTQSLKRRESKRRQARRQPSF